MRVTICAAGRLRRSPEGELTEERLKRFAAQGRAVGLGPAEVVEIVAAGRLEGRALAAAEARLFRAALGDARFIALDERGEDLDSEGFTEILARARDSGIGDLGVIVGGADGLDPALRDDALHVVRFGRMTWPHLWARAMLAEQLYRAACILTRHPYHRRME